MLLRDVFILPVVFLVFQVCTIGQTGKCLAQEKPPASVNDAISKLLNGEPGPYMVKPEDDEQTKLLKQRVNIARIELLEIEKTGSWGKPPEFTIGTHKRVLNAQIELFDYLNQPEDALSALNESLDRARRLEREMTKEWGEGKISTGDVSQVIYFRLGIELKILRAKEQKRER